MERFDGKVCIVTGAAMGIGRECARVIALERGAAIVAADLNEAGVRKTADEINQQGGKALAFVGDMADGETIRRLVETTVSTYGRLDMLSSNVAATSAEITAPDTTFDNYDEEYILKILRINTCGGFLLLKHCIPEMLRTAGKGAIVCMSSVAAKFGGDFQTVYGMSKAALEKLVRGTAAMYGRQGIRINAVEPSCTITPALVSTYPADLLEAMRNAVYNPDFTDGRGIATVVAFLLSEEAYTIQGATIPADNGYHIMSGMSGTTLQYKVMSGRG